MTKDTNFGIGKKWLEKIARNC